MMRRSLAALVVVATMVASVGAQSTYVPQRAYDTARRTFIDTERLLADLAAADVVVIGEQHDNLATHRIELALLEGLARRRPGVVLSLEMFERDVQEPLAHFLMGHTSETEFLAAARPWPQYARDYKPLVDFALARRWTVLPANVPRSIAADVSRSGLTALTARPAEERAWFARDLQCAPRGRYFERFTQAMGGASHEAGEGVGFDAPTLERYYAAQCLKDETMAESIAEARAVGVVGSPAPLVVHVTGAFHSEYGQGTVERVRRRLPRARVRVLSILPIAELDTLEPGKDDRRRADYLIYTTINPT